MDFSAKHLWYLVSLKLSGEATPEEQAELDALLKAHPEAGFQITVLEELWRSQHSSHPAAVQDAYNKHLQRLSNHLSEPVLQYETPEPEAPLPQVPPRRFEAKKLAWYAGAAAVLAGAVFGFFLLAGKSPALQIPQNEVSTRHGSKSKIQLPDGSTVWLNSGSKLTYNENFGGSLREVRLTGEAYFDVVKDKSKPFIIHTDYIDIKVLGTAFNVRAYPDEKSTETALIRGAVEVKVLDNPNKQIVLQPSEKLVVQHAPAITEKGKSKPAQRTDAQPLISILKVHSSMADSSVLETLWVENKLAFDNEPLETIALKLERWYDVDIIIADEALTQNTYTATFEGESLKEVMDALQVSGKFAYSINRKEVRIGTAKKAGAAL